jgi:membrane protein YqaA with SNARE-associated domain
MVMWLGTAFGLACLSAVVPVLSIELFLIGLVTQRPDLSPVALGGAIAAGQVLGKMVHYYAARGAVRLPSLLRRTPRADRPSGRVVSWTRSAALRARDRPGWMVGVLGTSSVVGLPPFGAMTVLAGLTGMRLSLFVAVGFGGRFIRYSCLAAAPAMLANLVF